MKRATLLIPMIVALLIASIAVAQSGGGYDLAWSTISSGGGTISGGAYALDGSIGQPAAGSLSGGSYTLDGGFWYGLSATAHFEIYLPMVLR